MKRISITCSECGEPLAVSSDDPRAEVQCVQCGTKNAIAAPRAKSPPSQPRRSDPSPSTHEESTPYQCEAPSVRSCPGCAHTLPEDAALCPACGFDLETGRRKRRTYEPISRRWEAGWPLSRRVRLFVLGQVVALLLGLLAAWILDEWSAFLAPWLVFAALTAFLLGTYACTELTRTERGKVRLTQTWRVCFIARPAQTIRRGDYEGVVSGKARAADFWDWVACIALFLAGILFGVLWWYFVIWRDSFFVALTQAHGFPERTLYWGWDEREAHDMEKTLSEIAFATT